MDIEALLSELNAVVASCADEGFANLGDARKLRLVSQAVRLQDQLHGLLMPAITETNDCKAFRARKSAAASSTSLVLASDEKMRQSAAGRIVNQADTATKILPKVHLAYCAGLVSRCQFNKLTAVAEQAKYRKIVGEYQDYFLGLCHLQYPQFSNRVDEWCEELDPTDPADLDAKAHDNRSMISAQGLGREVLTELKLPNAQHDLLMDVLEPFYDTLLHLEYREAAELRRLDPSLSVEELAEKLSPRDLARTRRQRTADALLMALRAANLVTKPAIEKLAKGEELTLKDIDPGALAKLVIVCDQETLEREVCRRAGIELEPRSIESLAKRRCETLSGRSLSPSQVVDLAPVSMFRRMMQNQTELDFTMTRETRFFSEIQKLGMTIRDRVCVTPGCSVGANKCEADHVARFAESRVTEVADGAMRCPACHRHKTRLESLGLWKHEVDDPETGARGLSRLMFGNKHEAHYSPISKRLLERERLDEAERDQLDRLVDGPVWPVKSSSGTRF